MRLMMTGVAMGCLLTVGCVFQDSTNTVKEGDEFQLMEASKLAMYKRALPKIAYPKIKQIFDDPATIWYDHQDIIPMYQDSVGRTPLVGSNELAPIGARFNTQGGELSLPAVRKLFTPSGKTFKFPFAKTAGTDNSNNSHTVNFIHLPKVGSKRLPITYWTKHDNSALGGLGVHKWSWVFPIGTTIGEMIFVKDGNVIYPSELRTRVRYKRAWAINVYRPFPTATHLSRAIKKARPSWQSQANLTALVSHLENKGTLQSKTLQGDVFRKSFSQTGALDILPDFGDDQLVKDLLLKTPFITSYKKAWKRNGSQVAYAASTNSRFSIVPTQYGAGVIEVKESSCERCHRDAGRPLEDFSEGAVLYGDIWGEDQIFSFHPWDRSRVGRLGDENRSVRPTFQQHNLVEKFSRAQHSEKHYSRIINHYDR